MDELTRRLTHAADTVCERIPADYGHRLSERPTEVTPDEAEALFHRLYILQQMQMHYVLQAKEAAKACNDAAGRIDQWFGPALHQCAEHRTKLLGAKTFPTEGTMVSWRKLTNRLEVVDKGKLRLWDTKHQGGTFHRREMNVKGLSAEDRDAILKALPEHLRTQVSFDVIPDKNKLNAHYRSTGEIPDGCEALEDQHSFAFNPAPKEALP